MRREAIGSPVTDGGTPQAPDGNTCIVAIDDHSRVSFACIFNPARPLTCACSALVDTLRYFQTLGVAFTRVMTDNGSCYRSKHFAKLCTIPTETSAISAPDPIPREPTEKPNASSNPRCANDLVELHRTLVLMTCPVPYRLK